MRTLILASARDDLAEGFDFYEQQQEGLGNYFLESLFSDIESLKIYAGIHPTHFGFRRLLAKRFPFAIYYEVEDRTVRVWAALDCRRDPAALRERLAGMRPR